MDILTVSHLTKIYGEGEAATRALDDVFFSVEEGEFVAIVGSSGSGKSTLLHLIGGVDRPTSGHVLLNGADVYARSDEELAVFRRREVGLVYQFYNLVPVLNVVENMTLPVALDGRAVNAGHLQGLVQRLGLAGREGHLPSQLSGGQQQRVSIARALAGNPSVILADEPTGALDSRTGREVLSFLQKLNREGDTVVLITHDNSIAVKAKRIVRLQDGKIIYDGDARDPKAVVQPEEDIDDIQGFDAPDGEEARA